MNTSKSHKDTTLNTTQRERETDRERERERETDTERERERALGLCFNVNIAWLSLHFKVARPPSSLS